MINVCGEYLVETKALEAGSATSVPRCRVPGAQGPSQGTLILQECSLGNGWI